MTVLLRPTSAAEARCERPCWCSSTMRPPSKRESLFAFAIRRSWQCGSLTGNDTESIFAEIVAFKGCGLKRLISWWTAYFNLLAVCYKFLTQIIFLSHSHFFFLYFEALLRSFWGSNGSKRGSLQFFNWSSNLDQECKWKAFLDNSNLNVIFFWCSATVLR